MRFTNRYLLLLLIQLGLVLTSVAKPFKIDSTYYFLPKERIYPAVFLDPIECQIYGGSNILSRAGSKNSLYSNFTFGFTKPLIQKHGELVTWEANFGAATFTQFELVRRDDGTYLAGLLNNDYKIGGDLSAKKGNNLLRIRFFHISSHLGDDYMTRYKDTINDKSVNYEQIDLTYLRQRNDNYLYLGFGEVYTMYVYRERLSFHGGGLVNFMKYKYINLFASTNIKLYAQNNFNPDIRTAFGFSFNRLSDPKFRIWLEYYSGNLPYSTLKYGRVNWVGIALWINMF